MKKKSEVVLWLACFAVWGAIVFLGSLAYHTPAEVLILQRTGQGLVTE